MKSRSRRECMPKTIEGTRPAESKENGGSPEKLQVIQKMHILNKLGLHLRAAAQLVKVSSKFKCRVLVKGQAGNVDAKSLLNLMALAASYGSELTLVFEGEDAWAARAAIH